MSHIHFNSIKLQNYSLHSHTVIQSSECAHFISISQTFRNHYAHKLIAFSFVFVVVGFFRLFECITFSGDGRHDLFEVTIVTVVFFTNKNKDSEM